MEYEKSETLNNSENLNNSEKEPTYQIDGTDIIYTGPTGQTCKLGIVLNQDNIRQNKANEWWWNVTNKINFETVVRYIYKIDSVVETSVNSGNCEIFELPYDIFDILFDNSLYCIKFSKSESKSRENKINFIKQCFTMNNLDLDKILSLKFPNGIIEYKKSNILVSIM